MYKQMGVARDGNKQLEKMDSTPTFAKSKMKSAKNAWGTELTHTHSPTDYESCVITYLW